MYYSQTESSKVVCVISFVCREWFWWNPCSLISWIRGIEITSLFFNKKIIHFFSETLLLLPFKFQISRNCLEIQKVLLCLALVCGISSSEDADAFLDHSPPHHLSAVQWRFRCPHQRNLLLRLRLLHLSLCIKAQRVPLSKSQMQSMRTHVSKNTTSSRSVWVNTTDHSKHVNTLC